MFNAVVLDVVVLDLVVFGVVVLCSTIMITGFISNDKPSAIFRLGKQHAEEGQSQMFAAQLQVKEDIYIYIYICIDR